MRPFGQSAKALKEINGWPDFIRTIRLLSSKELHNLPVPMWRNVVDFMQGLNKTPLAALLLTAFVGKNYAPMHLKLRFFIKEIGEAPLEDAYNMARNFFLNLDNKEATSLQRALLDVGNI
jgi:hypothetical protein